MRRNEDDRLNWLNAKKVKFIVKSFNYFLRQERAITFLLKATQNLIVPIKVWFFFAWKAVKRKVLM